MTLVFTDQNSNSNLNVRIIYLARNNPKLPFFQKINPIRWFLVYDNGEMGKVRFLEETDSKIFVLLSDPLKPQKKPRVDVLEIACDGAEGATNEETARDTFLPNLWK